jgi:transposase
LTDNQWQKVKPFVEKSFGRPAQVPRREVVNAILYVLRTGCQWRYLPREFPAWSAVYACFRRWQQDGTWHRLHAALHQQVRLQAGRAAQPSAVILDSQSVKTTEPGTLWVEGQEATTKPRT